MSDSTEDTGTPAVPFAGPNEIIATPDGAPLPHGNYRQERGAQVHLTGIARAAARGGLHGDIVSNTMAQHAEFAAGRAADGLTPDGSTRDGRLPPDVLGGADQVVYGEPGVGEGSKGSRPGDAEVAQAEHDANQARQEARKQAVEQAKQ